MSPAPGRSVTRVRIDGPAGAGKTSNAMGERRAELTRAN
jgi:hypothetical protein